MGLVSGGLNPESRLADEHAIRAYESIKKSHTDFINVARHTGFSIEQIQIVKHYLFRSIHIMSYKTGSFDPDYAIAESWRRLSSKDGKNIQKHDVLLIYHELYEIELLLRNQNMTQQEAHNLAEQKYNYGLAVKRFYSGQKFRTY